MKVLIIGILLLAPILFVPKFSGKSQPLRGNEVCSIPGPTPTPTPAEKWWQKLLRIAGISANPGAQRSPANKGPDAGEIWVRNLMKSGGTRIAVGRYQSPIFLARDETILALKDQTIVRIPSSGGDEQSIPNNAGIVRLIGVSQDSPDQVLVLMKNNEETSIGLLSLKDNQVTAIAYETETTEGAKMFARISGWDRTYCNTEIYVEEQCEKNQDGECKKDRNDHIKTWTDVIVKWAYKDPLNISGCKGLNCGQPSLSLDGVSVVYIRQPH